VRILRPTVPASIDAAVTRALAREPVDRYRSAGDFAEALQQALRQDERGASPRPGATPQPDVRSTAPSRGRRSRNVAVVGLASLAVILSIASWTVWHRDTITALDANKIVIVPFGVTGADSSLNRLADAVAVNLAPMFTDEGGLRAVDSPTAIDAWTRVSDRRPATAAIARDVALDRRARYGLFGTIMGESGRLTLSANIVDARTGESRPLTPVQGSRDSVQAVLDRLVAQLLVRRAGVPERLVADLTSESLPALRAYLDGRAAYRRAHNGDAIRNFNRALDRDSTFALAALDLATATGKLLRQPVCSNNECTFASTLPGFRDTGPRRDDASFDRGLDLAWRFQSKLGPRDLPLLDALRGQDYPKASDAKATLAALERAAKAADDRAETQYLLGVVVLSAGPSLGYSDALARAEGLFNEARHLDSGFLAPLARLVDVSAYQGDLAKLRRFGAQYLAQDSTGPAADFVRWRVAVITNDRAMLRAIQARFDSLDLMTLQQIVVASQMSGVALEDADSAAAIVVSRATNPKERGAVLFEASTVALNRGRPHRADSLLRLRAELESTPFGFWHGTTWAALFGDGIDASAEWSARERREWLAHDTLPNTVHIPDTMIEAGQESLWDWTHGRMAEAQALAGWIRLHGDPERPAVVRRLADITDMLVAGSSRRADAATLRAVVDSESLHGCCPAPQTIDLSLASAYELAGDDSAAIRVLRRGRWGRPLFLTTFLLREGRLAERLGDRDGAIRAYEHYLALRSNPEPQLVPQRDSVRARVNALRAQLAHDQTLVDRVRRWLHTW
jgi:TolB-like protein